MRRQQPRVKVQSLDCSRWSSSAYFLQKIDRPCSSRQHISIARRGVHDATRIRHSTRISSSRTTISSVPSHVQLRTLQLPCPNSICNVLRWTQARYNSTDEGLQKEWDSKILTKLHGQALYDHPRDCTRSEFPTAKQQNTIFRTEVNINVALLSDDDERYRTDFRFTPAQLLNGREFWLRLKQFFEGPSKHALFYSCPTFTTLVPKLADDAGLAMLDIPPCNSENPLSGFHTFLVKTEDFVKDDAITRLDAPLVDGMIDEILAPRHVGQALLDIRPFCKEQASYLLQHHWRLLLSACKGYVDALPALSINRSTNVPAPPRETAVGRNDISIEFTNATYGISISRRLKAVKDVSPDIAEALVEYCWQIRDRVKDTKGGKLSFLQKSWQPAEFMGRANRKLDWGNITHVEKTLPLPWSKFADTLHSSEVHIGERKPIGKPAVWFSRKHARLMAVMDACAELQKHLQAKYRAGDLLAHEYQSFARFWDEEVSFGEEIPSTTRHPAVATAHDLSIDGEIVSKMVQTLRQIQRNPFDSSNQWAPASDIFEHNLGMSDRNQERAELSAEPNVFRFYTPDQQGVEDMRKSLPILQPDAISRVRNAVLNNQVTIVKADTGSGKTTQIPQIILDQHLDTNLSFVGRANVICTQPRRVSTVAVAKRVAEERQQDLGIQVGYQVRFDNRAAKSQYGINYMTSGYLLRLLEADPVSVLSQYTHIILDEIHEQDIDTDLILTALSNLLLHPLPEIPELPKIILMSATLDPVILKNYFSRVASKLPTSIVEVPGRNFPVKMQMLHELLPRIQQRYPSETSQLLLEDEGFSEYVESQDRMTDLMDLDRTGDPQDDTNGIADNEASTGQEVAGEELENLYVPIRFLSLVIRDILSTSTSGDILTFLPGLAEIEELEKILLEAPLHGVVLKDETKYRIFKLHSALYETNYDVFKPVPSGCRRIVLATNIAETSITLPAVEYVIDTGYSRQGSFDQSSLAGSFGIRWISKAEVSQRKGRAGRTRPGMYLASYSQGQYEAMLDKPVPEMLRASLDAVVLRTQASRAFRCSTPGENVPGKVLELAPSVPRPSNVAAAGQQLIHLRALASNGDVTAMGKVMSRLPTSPAESKAILLGLIFRCLDPMMFFASMRDDIVLMNHPTETSAVTGVRKLLCGSLDDDKIADWNAFTQFDFARRELDPLTTANLKESYFLRHDSYCVLANTCNQIFETLGSMLGRYNATSYDNLSLNQPPQPLFPCTLGQLNTNSNNMDLVKAIHLSSAGTRFAFWDGQNWRAAHFGRVMPSPRSVNHIVSRKKDPSQKLRREKGDILTYSFLRIQPDVKHPWVFSTSIVSPLSGMLFGESLRLDGHTSLLVNDWQSYKITVAGSSPITDSAVVAKVILEYRKALDRFLAYALEKIALDPHKLRVVREGKWTAADFNVFFQEADHPLRKIFVDSVVDILAIDARKRKERFEGRLRAEESAL